MALIYKKDFLETHKEEYDYLGEEDFNLLLKKLPLSPSRGTLLDLACGSGVIGKLFKNKFPELEVVGMDICLSLLKWAKFPVCQSDVFNLPFKNDSFDLIISAGAFHHFSRIDYAIKECYRCLKPNGIFMAFDPNKFHPQRFIMMTAPLRHIFYKVGDRALSPIYFKKSLIAQGIKNVNISYVTFKWKGASSFNNLNYQLFNKISKTQFNKLLPILSPWFIITGVKL
ncbi:MAG: methyltransferase domain-containing protein [Desulfobacterales bacterium]|nr:methyltransferase domain-containing protein [Desulfobacterales bacterium]